MGHVLGSQALAVTSTVESATFGIGGKRFYLSARHGRRDDQSETLDIHLHLDNSTVVQPEIQVGWKSGTWVERGQCQPLLFEAMDAQLLYHTASVLRRVLRPICQACML